MIFIENQNTELKEIYVSDIKKEVIAFANTDGGIIYIGVKDNGDVVGVENPDFVMTQITNSLKDSIKPDITMFTRVDLTTADDKPIIKITVNSGTKKPYYLSEKGLKTNGVFVRRGTSTQPSSDDLIREMIKLSDGDIFEENRSVNQELSFTSLKAEMNLRNIEFERTQMKSLGILSADDIYTNMGLLVSDECPHTIKFAIFEGNNKLIFKDRKELSGSLFNQMNDAYKTIDFYNATKATFDNLLRIDERNFPEDAVREALLNAIVHRDYSFSGSTFINIYNDKLEIISLGGLVSGLSLEAAKIGVSQPRNKNLATLFYRMKLIEAYGTGLSKIISCYEKYKVKPIFETVDGAFRVVLPNVHYKQTRDISSKYMPILNMFDSSDEITRKDIETELSVSTTYVVNILKEMVDENIIIKLGNGKTTRYKKS